MPTPPNTINGLTKLPPEQMRYLLRAANNLDSQTILSDPFDGEMTGADTDEVELAIAQRNIELLMQKAEAACLMPSVVNELAHMIEMDLAMRVIHGDATDGEGYCSTGN